MPPPQALDTDAETEWAIKKEIMQIAIEEARAKGRYDKQFLNSR
jgi:hypothetical protein